MSAGNLQPGWQFVHDHLGPLRHTLRERLAQARLQVGEADRALTESEYLAWMQQQTAMLRELAPQLEEAVRRVSEEASGMEVGASMDELDERCEWLAWKLAAVVSWAQAVWRTTPPGGYRGSFEAFRALPSAILDQFDPYFEVVAAAAGGRLSVSQTVQIDIQQFIDEAARRGTADVARQNRASAGGSGCLIAVLVVAIWAWCAWLYR